MWDSIPLKLQNEWEVYLELEPTLVERSDWNFAHVVQAIAHTGKTLKEFVLPFGDRPTLVVVQSLAYQEMLIDAWVGTNNAMYQKRS